MTTTVEMHKVNGENVAKVLDDLRGKLAEGEVALDFTDVLRIDPAGLRAFEDLAAIADEKAVKIVLRGVNVDVYKVLKLTRLTARFSFVN